MSNKNDSVFMEKALMVMSTINSPLIESTVIKTTPGSRKAIKRLRMKNREFIF